MDSAQWLGHMTTLLFEILCEEIPARMQAEAVQSLEKAFAQALTEHGIAWSHVDGYATPRRLTLYASGLPIDTPDTTEERRGPRLPAADAALAGFLKSTGLTREALVERDDGKGRFLYAHIHKPGRATAQVIAEIIPHIMRNFSWPKSMRWGVTSISMESLRWVRPLQSVLCLFNNVAVPFTIGTLHSGTTTLGHRFMSHGAIPIQDSATYKDTLRAHYVMLDPTERAARIKKRAEALAQTAGLTLIEDADLLAENAALTEWPVPLLGRFDESFLCVPPEVITLTLRHNQKYFSLRDQKTGALSNAFICVANLESQDDGQAIVAGNQKVLRARLSDARFFWEQDQKTTLEAAARKLKNIVFHEKIGTMDEKIQRMLALAERLAPLCGAPAQDAQQATRLCKADLVSHMVGEFPELQGIIGSHLARVQGLSPAVADALREHYGPLGKNTPTTQPVSIVVALADKFDTLQEFDRVGIRPTGSSDPFGLRRAALQCALLILHNGLRFPLEHFLSRSVIQLMLDRWLVHKKSAGGRADLVLAMLDTCQNKTDLSLLETRAAALEHFLAGADGAHLLAGYKRALNILKIEEKKSNAPYTGDINAHNLVEPEEQALHLALIKARERTLDDVAREDFTSAFAALAALRSPIDVFFEKVTVNADDAKLRLNRLNLLAHIRTTVHSAANFSQIEQG